MKRFVLVGGAEEGTREDVPDPKSRHLDRKIFALVPTANLTTTNAVQAMVGATIFWTMSVPAGRAPVQPATPTANPSHRDTGRCPGQIPALLKRFAQCSSHHHAASARCAVIAERRLSGIGIEGGRSRHRVNEPASGSVRISRSSICRKSPAPGASTPFPSGAARRQRCRACCSHRACPGSGGDSEPRAVHRTSARQPCRFAAAQGHLRKQSVQAGDLFTFAPSGGHMAPPMVYRVGWVSDYRTTRSSAFRPSERTGTKRISFAGSDADPQVVGSPSLHWAASRDPLSTHTIEAIAACRGRQGHHLWGTTDDEDSNRTELRGEGP